MGTLSLFLFILIEEENVPMESEGLPVALVFPNRDTSIEILRAAYRQALVEVGHSPDFHIYDLDSSFLVRKQNLAAGRFLLKLYWFYLMQEDLARRIFVCDFLEKGRHYHFWWFDFCTTDQFCQTKSEVYRSLHTILNF
jgi:hypothetical protein